MAYWNRVFLFALSAGFLLFACAAPSGQGGSSALTTDTYRGVFLPAVDAFHLLGD
jgi:hypothetical protein